MDMTLKIQVPGEKPKTINITQSRLSTFNDEMRLALGDADEYEIVECCPELQEMLTVVPLDPNEQVQTIRVALINMKSYGAAPLWMFIKHLVRRGLKVGWSDVGFIATRGYNHYRSPQDLVADHSGLRLRDMMGFMATHIQNRIPLDELVNLVATHTNYEVIRLERDIMKCVKLPKWIEDTYLNHGGGLSSSRLFMFQTWNEDTNPRS